jgi:hypothetical protein
MEENLYEILIADEADEVYAISLVDQPAIESDFLYFSAETNSAMTFKKFNTEQQMVIGAIMIPDIRIPRANGLEVFFSKETVRQLSHRFLMRGKTDAITTQHMQLAPEISLVESWLVEDPECDKSAKYGFYFQPGTWVGIMKINDRHYWESFIKTGILKGFSIELKTKKIKKITMEDEVLTPAEGNVLVTLPNGSVLEVAESEKTVYELTDEVGNKYILTVEPIAEVVVDPAEDPTVAVENPSEVVELRQYVRQLNQTITDLQTKFKKLEAKSTAKQIQLTKQEELGRPTTLVNGTWKEAFQLATKKNKR